MNGTHIAIGGGITAMIAGVLVWLTHWPLQPLDEKTAMDIAGLIVAIFGGGAFGIANFLKKNGDESSPPATPNLNG